MICDRSGKNKSPFFSFTADHVLKRCWSRDQCLPFENFMDFYIDFDKYIKFEENSPSFSPVSFELTTLHQIICAAGT